ncbi:MAG: primosomal protein N' [Anaerolineae bacterium]|nr:primosomal protein N' [Anaerolineae bacterium]
MSNQYVQVAVNVPQVNNLFDYHLPNELLGQVQPGCLVVVPFGNQRVQGIVLTLSDVASISQTRDVEALLDPHPVLTPAQMKLAQRLAQETLTSPAACLSLMVPAGLTQLADTLYSLVDAESQPVQSFSPIQQRLISLLERRGGSLRGRQIEAALPRQHWQAAARALVQAGKLTRQPVLPPPGVHARTTRMVNLAGSPQQIQAYLDKPAASAAAQRRQRMLSFLIKEPWPVEASWVYAAAGGGSLADLTTLAEAGLVNLSESEIWRDPLEKMDYQPHHPPPLTGAQQNILTQINQVLNRSAQSQPVKPYLLHGVTGSGKTEIYLQAAAETLKTGRQVIILVPEISLTPQTVRRFMARFPGQVGLVHSQLSPGERYDTWRRARAGLISVVVGARSALFTPFADPGLVVIDECHENTYYQDDLPPYYNALSAAEWYTQANHALLLLGSATPPIDLFERVKQGDFGLLSLPDRVLAHRESVERQLKDLGQNGVLNPAEGEAATLPLPPVKLVDMREELKTGNRSMFSRALKEALSETLSAGQQAVLFLNRRGSATYVFCRECGYVLRCPRCDLPLTYHSDEGGSLRCHSCAYRRQMPKTCPACGSRQIRQYGAGTEKVEAEVLELFPQARTLRWDYESTRTKGAHDLLLSHFLNRHADILIGTQMLAKGLDMPMVTLVGVVLADVGLNLPDYRAAERTFQLLMQVSGRAGRSPLGGRVVLQTFQPDHYAIQAAAAYDFEGFKKRELDYRRNMLYPPFARLARLEYRSQSAAEAESAAGRLADKLNDWIRQGQHNASQLIGPAPCFFSKVNGYYRWQIILRSPDPAAILRGRSLEGWRVQLDPLSVL